MRSQCPKYAMHAKEIGLRIMRSFRPTGGKGGKVQRTAPIVGDITTKNYSKTPNVSVPVSFFHDVHAPFHREPKKKPPALTEIKAHSPRYSINVGRVLSINAGAASTAVAKPVLTAYLTS